VQVPGAFTSAPPSQSDAQLTVAPPHVQARQTMPQPPQLLGSDSGSVHAPLHPRSLPLQQTPCEHELPDPHFCPHPPQLRESEKRFVHVPSQRVGTGSTHA
jgi:hypothetical protein